MNLADIKYRVKRQFGDESSAQVTDADIVRWANDAMIDIAIKNNCLETRATSDIVAGQKEYDVPTGILRLQSVRYKGVRLKNMSMQELDEIVGDSSTTTGVPTVFSVYADQLILFPTPDTSETGALVVYYNRVPTALAVDADTPELPVAYHSRIVEFCLQNAYEMDEDWQAAGNKAAQFVDGLNTLRADDTQYDETAYPTITVLADDL